MNELIPGRRHVVYHNFTWRFRHPITATGLDDLRIRKPAGSYPMLDVIASVCRDGPQASDYQGVALQRFKVCQGQWGATFLWLLQQQLDLWDRQQWPFLLPELRAWEMFAKVDYLHFEMCKWIANYLPTRVSGYSNHWQHYRALLLESYWYSVNRPLPSKRDYRTQVRQGLKEIKELKAVRDPEQPILYGLQNLVFKAQKCPGPTTTPGRVELQSLMKQYQVANRQMSLLADGKHPDFSFKVFCERDGALHVRHEGRATQAVGFLCAN